MSMLVVREQELVRMEQEHIMVRTDQEGGFEIPVTSTPITVKIPVTHTCMRDPKSRGDHVKLLGVVLLKRELQIVMRDPTVTILALQQVDKVYSSITRFPCEVKTR